MIDATIEDVCQFSWLSSIPPFVYYGFPASQFSKGPIEMPIVGATPADAQLIRFMPTLEGDFDMDSIMTYDPAVVKDIERHSNIYNVPFVAWNEGGKDYVPPATVNEDNAHLIPFNSQKAPSKGDVANIIKLYPWPARGVMRRGSDIIT